MRFRSGSDENRGQPKGKPWANERITRYNSIVLGLKVIKQKVSFIKTNTIHMLLFEPKSGAKLTFSYGIRKFYARAYAHI